MDEISKSRTIALAISVGLGYLTWGLLIALQPPFYPSEAEKKGATPSQYGFVFGIANLAAVIMAPFFGCYGSAIGPKLLYNVGAFMQAIVGISFGFLDFVDNKAAFLGLSYTLRFIGGVADAAALGAVISILIKLYPKYVTSIVSWTEMLFGLGYMLGPALGSALYSVGGFYLPFITVGSVALVAAVLLLIIVPNVKPEKRNINDGRKSLTFAALIRSPLISMPFFDNFICYCGHGMIESMLEPHMKSKAGATQTEVSLTFLIVGGCYMFTTPIIGYICDKIRYPTVLSVIGNCLMATAFLLIGPIPFIPLTPSVSLIQGAVTISGLGYGMIFVSAFGRSQKAAIGKGYNNDIDTYLIISGMWSCSFYSGNFVGPTTAGILVENYGFQTTTLLFFSLYIFTLIIDLFELGYILKYVRVPEKEDCIDMEEKEMEIKEEPIKQ